MATITSNGNIESMETSILSALEVLFQQPQEPMKQQAADAYLRSFQTAPEAYTICATLLDRLLTTNPSQVSNTNTSIQSNGKITSILFFLSQTLALKLRRQHPFPSEINMTYYSWSRKCLCWLEQSIQLTKVVQTQLIRALVACVPHIRNVNFGENTNTKGPISTLLDQLMTMHLVPSVTAEILKELVEEIQDIDDFDIRNCIQLEIDEYAGIVLNQLLPQIMHNCFSNSTNQDCSTQLMVLRALRNWLRQAIVPAEEVVKNQLIQSIREFLSHEELFEACVDLIVDIIHDYHDMKRDAALIQWLIPQLMELKIVFNATMKEEKYDTCKGLCRIFTEMAESHMKLLIDENEMNQVALVELVLDCMSYPDNSIADITIPFWFRFLDELNDLKTAQKQLLLKRYTDSAQRLAVLCVQNLRFHDDFLKLPGDQQQDFKDYRVDLGDILRDLCAFIGAEPVLVHCVSSIQQIISSAGVDNNAALSQQWKTLEAYLYCFRSIARHVEKAPGEITHGPVNLLMSYLPQLPPHPAIQYTSCLIVSRYAEWLHRFPTCLPALLDFMNSCINNAPSNDCQNPDSLDWEVPRAAAFAFRALATDCWNRLGNDIMLFYFHVEMHDQKILSVEDQILLLEGISGGVVKSKDMNGIVHVLEQVVGRILDRLTRLFAMDPVGQAPVSIKYEILRLICLYEYMNIDEHIRTSLDNETKSVTDSPTITQNPLVQLTTQIWPYLNQVLQLYHSNEVLVEHVCRCYKRILRTCRTCIKPLLPSLVNNIITYCQTDPKSSYIYAGSMIIKYYGDDKTEEMQSLLLNLLYTFANTAIPVFQNIQEIARHPDVIEEFFFLMDRCIKSVPELLLHQPPQGVTSSQQTSELLPTIWQWAVLSLEVPHSDANKAALAFLESALTITISGNKNASQRLVSTIVELCEGQSGSTSSHQLHNTLMRGIVCGSLPASRVDAGFGSISGVLVCMTKLNGLLLQQLIASWFQHQLSIKKIEYLSAIDIQRFQNDLFKAENERAFRRVIRHFAGLCDRRISALHRNDA